MEFIKSRRGGDILCIDHHMFRLNYRRNDKSYWKCTRSRQGCNATAVTQSESLISSKGNHNHVPSESNIRIKKIVEQVKDAVKEDVMKPVKRAYEEAIGALDMNDEANLDDLPSFSKYRSALYRSRAKALPKIPHTRAELNITEEWATTVDGRNFVVADDGLDDRLLIFGTQQNLRYLCEAETVFMDGTFQISPEMFLQLYTLHVMRMGTMVPLCFCLLHAKNSTTYRRMFQLIQTACRRYGLEFQPSVFAIDFENSVITTISQLFPQARIRGCLFHFTRAIWRRVQSLGLTTLYQEDQGINKLVRRSMSLPLVPTQHVDDVWIEAMNEVDNEIQGVSAFKDYITTTWVDSTAARYPVEIWNQFDNLHGVRTTNHLESWHNKIKRSITRSHPNIFRVIQIFKEQQRETEQTIQLLQAGGSCQLQRRKYRVVTERLVRLKTRLENGDITPYHYAGVVGGIMTVNTQV